MSHTITRLNERYAINWLFDENYRSFFKLFSEQILLLEQFTLNDHRGREMVCFDIIERHKYTVDIELSRPVAFLDNLPDLVINFRLYFDARVIEVTGFQGIKRIPASIDSDSGQGQSHDDKLQVNMLLYELFHLCLKKRYRSKTQKQMFATG